MTETHRAGQIIGYRRDGRAIRLQAGGSMPATETPPAPADGPAAPPAPAQPAAPAAPAQPPAPDPAPAGQQRNPDGTFAPAPAPQPPVPQPPAQQVPAQQAPADPTDWRAVAEQARAEVERVRAEAQADVDRWKKYARQHEDRLKMKNETVRGQDAILREIALKVGVDYDDTPDPAQLATALAEQTQRTRDLSVERAIYLGAAREGADAVALLDSREFLAKAGQLDPESAGFPDLVRDLVRDAAKEDRYKLAVKTLTPQDTVPPAQLQPAAQFQQPPAQQAAPVQPQPQPPAPASGADFSGAPAGDGLWDQQTYDYWATGPGKAIDRNGKIMSDAIAQGKLVRLGVGPSRRPSSRR